LARAWRLVVSEAIVFVSHLRIKEGMAGTYRDLQRRATQAFEAEKPRTLVFLPYLDEAGSSLTIFHVFADPDAMDAHFEGAEERSRSAFEYLVPEGWEIYGAPSDQVMESMRRLAASRGIPLTVHPELIGGFLRPTASGGA
jgi:hypothetical protein